MIKDALAKLMKNQDLSEFEAINVMEQIMTGGATDAQIAGFLVALRLKGETIDEIAAFAKVMRQKATKINVGGDIDIDREEINLDNETIVDTCGTGGTGTNTFNISTASAFVVAGAGVKVAKHGNRAASSACGSADVLSQLGIGLNVSPERVAECIRKINIGFLYAPVLHNAMKYAIGPRRQMGIRTVFNILGPLTNPAGAKGQVLGVYDPELTEKMANVLLKLGTRRAFVVHGEDCLDEITITGKTKISEVNNDKVSTYYIHPKDFNMEVATLQDIQGGDAEINAKIVMDILQGKKGTKRDIVVLNSAYALLAADKVTTPQEGVILAEKSIDSGEAKNRLEQLWEMTR